MTFPANYDRICATISAVFAVMQYFTLPASPAPISPPAMVVVIQVDQSVQLSESTHLIVRQR